MNRFTNLSKRRGTNTTRKRSMAKAANSALMARAEHKYYTFTPASAITSSAAGIVYNLTRDLIEGDNVEQRSGRRVQQTQSIIRISGFLPALGLAGVLRFIWVSDKLNTGTLPTVAEILDSAAVTSGYSLNSVSNSRFTILHDETRSMVVGGSNQHITPIFNNYRKSNILYNGSTAVNTSNGVGSQFLLVITDLAANQPVYTVDYVLHYVDI